MYHIFRKSDREWLATAQVSRDLEQRIVDTVRNNGGTRLDYAWAFHAVSVPVHHIPVLLDDESVVYRENPKYTERRIFRENIRDRFGVLGFTSEEIDALI